MTQPPVNSYDEFHAGMEQLGLGRTITRDGKVYKLPTGLYLGLSLFITFNLLNLKIAALAHRVTRYPCKLTLIPVDAATVYISGLEEDTSYAAQLGLYAGSQYNKPASQPNFSSLRAMMELAGTMPKPATTPDTTIGYLATLMKR